MWPVSNAENDLVILENHPLLIHFIFRSQLKESNKNGNLQELSNSDGEINSTFGHNVFKIL